MKTAEELRAALLARMNAGLPIEPLLSYETTGLILDCSASKVQKMVLAGELPFIKVGNETRILPEDLRAWIRGRRQWNREDDGEGNWGDSNTSQAIPTKEATHVK